MDINAHLYTDVSFIDLGDLCIAVFPEFAEWRLVNRIGRGILELCRGSSAQEIIERSTRMSTSLSESDVVDFLRGFLKDGLIIQNFKSSGSESLGSLMSEDFSLTNVGFNLTEYCNLSCIHCFANSGPSRDRTNELSPKAVMSTIDRLLSLGSPDFIFSGGEPLIRKELLMNVILKLRKDSNVDKVKVITNGTLLDKRASQFFVRNRVEVQVSLDGSTPEIHDSIRGSGSFNRAMAGIKMLVASGVKTSTCTTVMKQNLNDVITIVQLALSLGVNEVQTQLMIPVGKASRNIDKIRIDPEEGLHTMWQARKIADKRGGWGYEKCSQYSIRKGRRIRPCDVGAYLYITSNGDMYPCAGLYHPEMKLGNVMEHKLSQVWFESPTLQMLRKLSVDSFSECRSCTYRFFCGGGCRGDVFLVKGNMFASNPFCKSEKQIIISKLVEDAIESIQLQYGTE